MSTFYSGPIYGFLCHKMSPRAAGILAGIITLIGFSAASVVESVLGLLISYGIITGLHTFYTDFGKLCNQWLGDTL